MTRVFLAVGSNLGDRSANLHRAQALIQEIPLSSFKESPVYETDPVGGPPQGKYLNAVWTFETNLEVRKLFVRLQKIEQVLGRKKAELFGPRTLDLDILFYGDAVIQKADLVIPHPRLQNRYFVLKPFCDLAPDWIHPKLKITIHEILERLLETNSRS